MPAPNPGGVIVTLDFVRACAERAQPEKVPIIAARPRQPKLRPTLLPVALALAACRAAYGIDPAADPAAAARAPGEWRAEVTGGLRSPPGVERYGVVFDGSAAWAYASVPGERGTRAWSRALGPEQFASFAQWALGLSPFEWSDRKSGGPAAEVLVLRIRAGDRGRSLRIEGPDATERGLVQRMRALAGQGPASPAR
jgi:hypothetical protein